MKAEAIFNAITSGAFDNYKQAAECLIRFYAPDMSIDRSEILKADKLLKDHFI